VTIDKAQRQQILESVDRLIRDRIEPRAAEIDGTDAFPQDLYNTAGALGIFGLWIPEAYGGSGPDLVTPLLISERMARASASFSLIFLQLRGCSHTDRGRRERNHQAQVPSGDRGRQGHSLLFPDRAGRRL
jgi:alkylation response protein AidB-like acyl-CoA dehydrogenase